MKISLLIWVFLVAQAPGAGRADASPPTWVNAAGMTFVYLAPGSFTMGSPPTEPGRHDDEARHDVAFTRGFYMAATEVTQGQWQRVMGGNPSAFQRCGADCPVEKVSWNDAQLFVQKMNELEKTDRYGLPTEAQWEYACRAGTQTPFNTGKCLSADLANYDASQSASRCPGGKFRKRTTPAASFPANAWGLYDMHGNVWEWCRDWYGRQDPRGAVVDPRGPDSGRYKVIRGGSWDFLAHDCRSANRDRGAPGTRLGTIGFRVVMAVPD